MAKRRFPPKFKYFQKVRVKETGQVGYVDAIVGGDEKPPVYSLKGFAPVKPYYFEDEIEPVEVEVIPEKPPKIPEPWRSAAESVWERFERPAFTKRDLERLVQWVYKECEDLEIDPETVDIYAQIDPALSIHENVQTIAETLKFALPEWHLKPPKVPRVVKPPPKLPPTLEEVAVCPLDPKRHPLTRFLGPIEIGIPIIKTVSIQERLKREYKTKYPEWTEWQVSEEVRREVWRRRELGLPTTETVTEVERRSVSIPAGFLIYHDDVRECAGWCRFHEIKDMKLRGMTYDELVERIRKAYVRVLKPLVPAPPPPRVPIVGAPIIPPTPREIETHPKFREWLEERTMTLDSYFTLLEETKRALRDAFFRTHIELFRGGLP